MEGLQSNLLRVSLVNPEPWSNPNPRSTKHLCWCALQTSDWDLCCWQQRLFHKPKPPTATSHRKGQLANLKKWQSNYLRWKLPASVKMCFLVDCRLHIKLFSVWRILLQLCRNVVSEEHGQIDKVERVWELKGENAKAKSASEGKPKYPSLRRSCKEMDERGGGGGYLVGGHAFELDVRREKQRESEREMEGGTKESEHSSAD